MITTKERIKNWTKCRKESKNIFVKGVINCIYFIYKVLHSTKMICTDKGFRHIIYMKIFKSKQIHQTTPFTAMNRYPEIFSACRYYFKDKENIKILSYGCSTGEEVLTLRHYFGNATIVGAEINKHSLEKCRSLPLDNKITFINSTIKDITENGPYDLVLCMAVLQRTPDTIKQKGITSLKKIYPFEKFEKQIIELDSYVKKDGLLVVHFSQYYLKDTVVSSKYTALGEYNQDYYSSAIFDKESNIIKEPHSRKSIFIKK